MLDDAWNLRNGGSKGVIFNECLCDAYAKCDCYIYPTRTQKITNYPVPLYCI